MVGLRSSQWLDDTWTKILDKIYLRRIYNSKPSYPKIIFSIYLYLLIIMSLSAVFLLLLFLLDKAGTTLVYLYLYHPFFLILATLILLTRGQNDSWWSFCSPSTHLWHISMSSVGHGDLESTEQSRPSDNTSAEQPVSDPHYSTARCPTMGNRYYFPGFTQSYPDFPWNEFS